MANLFVNQSFISHAGLELPFKIDCDALDPADIETIASLISSRITFRIVFGIPRGGARLAQALLHHVSLDGPILIVDDVYTTGKSMEKARQVVGDDSIGVVIFSRDKCPSWIYPVFQLSEWITKTD